MMSMESPKHRWRSSAQSGQKRSNLNVQRSPPQFHSEDRLETICPTKAWYNAVDVSLLSWWIALCACRGTPGSILELS